MPISPCSVIRKWLYFRIAEGKQRAGPEVVMGRFDFLKPASKN